ncbi:MAG: polysaccharide biosynthesis tyrosine autokinase [Solirubrobacteraceae bacterium]
MAVLRRRAVWIAASLLLVGLVTLGVSALQTTKYTASASLVFQGTDLAEQLAGLATATSGASTQQVDTDVQLLQIGDIAERTANRIGHGLTSRAVKSSISIAADGDTNVVAVAATDGSPHVAQAIANTYAATFVAEQESSNRAYYASALATVEKQISALAPVQRNSADGLALQERAQSLATLAELPDSTVEFAAAATLPTVPSSPKTKRNTALGALLGLVLGVIGALVLDRLDVRIHGVDEFESIYKLPILGAVPQSNSLGPRGKSAGALALSVKDVEAFHFIRGRLRFFSVDRQVRSVLVVSAEAADGKSTVSRGLAAAAAQSGSEKVLMIEADLRRPTAAGALGLRASPGLADVLIGSTSLDDATQTVSVGGESTDGGSLRVLVAGSPSPPNPGELLRSNAMQLLLAAATTSYDLVVIDTPPLTAVSDVLPLLRLVDGVIAVGRPGHDRRHAAANLRDTLEASGGVLLGVVVNGLKVKGTAYDAYYTSPGS